MPPFVGPICLNLPSFTRVSSRRWTLLSCNSIFSANSTLVIVGFSLINSIIMFFCSVLDRFCIGFVSVLYRFCIALVRPCIASDRHENLTIKRVEITASTILFTYNQTWEYKQLILNFQIIQSFDFCYHLNWTIVISPPRSFVATICVQQLRDTHMQPWTLRFCEESI